VLRVTLDGRRTKDGYLLGYELAALCPGRQLNFPRPASVCRSRQGL
jgi:hypothetical protein